MMQSAEPDRQKYAVQLLTENLVRVSGMLYLLPVIASAVALTAPVAELTLQPGEGERLTLGGMVGEFGDLESAFGVQPVVVVALAGLLIVLVTGVAAAWRSVSDRVAPTSRPRRWLSTGVLTCGVFLVLAAFGAAVVIDSADHVNATVRGVPPFEPSLSGAGMILLAGVVAILVAAADRRVTE